MSLQKAVLIFLIAAAAAWFAAYAPGMWNRQATLAMLDEAVPRWVCVINGDAVSSEYEGYVTKKYIMLGGQRFYSEEFKRWGRAADHYLVVIDDNQRLRWMRLDRDETADYARAYGLARVGCRRMAPGDHATSLVLPLSPPVENQGLHGAPTPPANYLQHPEDFTPRPDVHPVPNAAGTPLNPSTPPAPAAAPATIEEHPREGTSGSFDWKRAVEPALGGSGSAPASSAPAPSNGGVTP